MKKNKMMRVASALLIAVLLTTSAISGTFAKYVTSDSANDTARVAKWGVTITPNGGTFTTDYETDSTTTTYTGIYSVSAAGNSGRDDVLAPGTTGDLNPVVLGGTPEVAVQVTYAATLTLTGWTLADDSEYFPIIFTVNNATYGIEGMKDASGNQATNIYANKAALITAVQNAINAYSAVYGPNQDLSVENTVATPDVTWEWAFEGNSDVNDTYLGDQAVNATASTITLAISTTVTQID